MGNGKWSEASKLSVDLYVEAAPRKWGGGRLSPFLSVNGVGEALSRELEIHLFSSFLLPSLERERDKEEPPE